MNFTRSLAVFALAALSTSVYAVDERNPEQRAPNDPSTHPQLGRQAAGTAAQVPVSGATRSAAASSTAQPQGSAQMRRAEAPDFVRNGLVYPENNRAFHRIGTP